MSDIVVRTRARRVAVVVLAAAAIAANIVVGLPAAARADTQPEIHTLAGGPTDGDGGPAADAFGQPQAAAVDAAGDIFEVDGYRIREVVASTGDIEPVVGNGYAGIPQPGESALTAQLADDDPIWVTPSGQLYFEDGEAVFTVGSDGNLDRVAVLGATTAVAVAPDGSIFYTPSVTCQILELPAGSSQQPPVVYAGDGDCNPSGSGVATEEPIGEPSQISITAGGALYFNDGDRVEKVTTTGQLSTATSWVSSSTAAAPSDGDAALDLPGHVQSFALDPAGDLFLYYGYHGGSAVLSVQPNGTISDVDDLPSDGSESLLTVGAGDLVLERVDNANQLIALLTQAIPGPATPTVVVSSAVRNSADTATAEGTWFSGASNLTQLSNGDLAFIDGSGAVRALTTTGGLDTIPVSGGTPYLLSSAPDDSVEIALHGSTNVTTIIRETESGSGQSIVAGGGSFDPDTTARPGATIDLPELADLVVGTDGTSYVTDENDSGFELISPTGSVTRLGFSAQGQQLAWDATDDVAWVDGLYLRSVDSSGHVNSVGLGESAPVAAGPDGSLYFGVGDTIVRRYPDGGLGHVAGSDGVDAPAQGDDIPAYGAAMQPNSLVVENDGSIVIADRGDDRLGLPPTAAEIRRIDPGFTPTIPPAPAMTATSAAPGEVSVVVPPLGNGRVLVAVLPAGEGLGDVYPTLFFPDNPNDAVETVDPDGTIHLQVSLVRAVGGRPLALSGNVTVVAFFEDAATNNQSPYATQVVDVAPDTTPPASPVFTSTPRPGVEITTVNVPTDPDVTRVVARYAIGDKPVASPTTGTDALNGQTWQRGEATIEPVAIHPKGFDDYTFTVWAIDVAGNVSLPASQTVPAMAVSGLTHFGATATLDTVKLSWGTSYPLPSYPQCGSIVRWAAASSAPATPSAGSPLYRGTATSTSMKVKTGRDYAYSGFTSCGTTGDASPPTSVVLRGTTITVGSAEGRKSAPVVLSARLIRADNHAALNRGITLFRRSGPKARWTKVKTVVASGRAAALVKVLHKKMQYYFAFAAGDGYLGSSSRVLTVS